MSDFEFENENMQEETAAPRRRRVRRAAEYAEEAEQAEVQSAGIPAETTAEIAEQPIEGTRVVPKVSAEEAQEPQPTRMMPVIAEPVQMQPVQAAQPQAETDAPAEAADDAVPAEGETTVQPPVRPERVPQQFGSRVTTREPVRREVTVQGVPRPEALRRAEQAQQTAGADVGDRPMYRRPVNAPGYSQARPVNPARRQPMQPVGGTPEEPEEKKHGKALIIVVAVVLVLALLVLGVLLIPDNATGVLGTVKHAVTGLLGGKPDEPGVPVSAAKPDVLEIDATPQQVTAGETITFTVTTTKDVWDVRLVDEDGEPFSSIISSTVDNTDSTIWILKIAPTEAYAGFVRAQVLDGDMWLETAPAFEIDVEAAENLPAIEDVTAIIPEETMAPEDTDEVVPEETVGEVVTQIPPSAETEVTQAPPEEYVELTETEEPLDPDEIVAEETPTLAPTETPTVPMAATTPEPFEAAVTEAPAEEAPAAQQVFVPVAAGSASPDLIAEQVIYDGSKTMTSYQRDTADIINMPAAEAYTRMPYGVLTFRGNAFRQNAAEGTVENVCEMSVLWKVNAGSVKGASATYYGIGWTGQPVIIKWSSEVRSAANFSAALKETKGLTEVIVAGEDGKLYFLNLKTGEETRKAVNVGYPMRGTPSIHPYGFPLMSVGQYARKMKSGTGDIGLRFYSLLDQKQVHLIDGLDKSFSRPYYAVGSFETSALIDPEADTMVTAGSNGLLYLTKLNTRFEYSASTGTGNLTISPSTIVMKSKTKKQDDKTTSIESSIAMYQNYVFYADMKGVLRCVDTTTLETVWAVETGDAVEAAIALDLDEDGTLWLYTANTLQNRKKGDCTIRRYNAATGEENWALNVNVTKKDKAVAGFRASPVIGQNGLGDYVYFTASYVSKSGGKALGMSGASNGVLLCVSKESGEVVWTKELGAYSYSSPVAVYNEAGKGWIIQGAGDGKLHLLDGVTGAELDTLKLAGPINASPAVYKNTLVIGTQGKGKNVIYGIELK